MTFKESMNKTNILKAIKRLNATYSSVISEIYQKIQEFGITVINFESNSSDFTFGYKASGRNTFNYDELMEIQKIIDPSAEDTHSLSVFGLYGTYTLRVRLAV